MKFIYADSNDSIFPDEYDYDNDWRIRSHQIGQRRSYAHDIFSRPPYDGLLLSMALVKSRFKFSDELRLRREGVADWFGLEGRTPKDFVFIGDCGAYSYINEERPRYTVDEVVEFYGDSRFTHGIAPDHIVKMCDFSNPSLQDVPQECQYRYDLTLDYAYQFITLSKSDDAGFEPIGAVQGWSPQSMTAAALELERMGYRYLAIGGLAGLKNEAIKAIVGHIRRSIKPATKIHLLGFSNADYVDEYRQFNITSIDSTSPMLRSFKDSRRNYYAINRGTIGYHAAIRIPEALGNNRLLRSVKRGILSFEDLAALERRAMRSFREYGQGQCSVDTAVDAIVDYQKLIVLDHRHDESDMEIKSSVMRSLCYQTLIDRPWEACTCEACRLAGMDIILFRGNVRNKLRGMHNLNVYHHHLMNNQSAVITAPINAQLSTVHPVTQPHQDIVFAQSA